MYSTELRRFGIDTKRQFQALLENTSEATAACLITMVQGDLVIITLGHWMVAMETGLIAGSITSAALIIWRTAKVWVVALLLGVTTAVVDYVVHPGGFGPVFNEAAVTGVGAAALSFCVALVWRSRAWRLEKS